MENEDVSLASVKDSETVQEETQIIDVVEESPIEVSADEYLPIIDQVEEDGVEVDIIEENPIIIEADTAFAAIGRPNDDMNHAILNNRELADQHPIEAITGLRNELNNIKSLKTVYSNKIGYANYFLWEDENPGHDNRVGLFVSLCQSANKICTYDGTSNVFGVVVDDAAFVGGQDDIVRDYKYALVACDGEVCVLCESDVVVGDCVMPNTYGVAQKTNSGYGYEVAAITKDEGSTCATIILNIPANQIDAFGNSVSELNERLDTDEINITSAINVANSAYQAIHELEITVQTNTDNVNHAVEVAESASKTAKSFADQISNASATAELARTIADTAASEAESIRETAVNNANEALESVNNLIENIKPITEWKYTDSETGEQKVGAEYLVNYIDNGLATKTEVQTVNSLREENTLAIKKNAEEFHSLMSSVDEYSLGLYSQSYGLYNKEQAMEILDDGIIYVPYDPTDLLGNYDYHERYLNGDTTYHFTQGYLYTWTDTGSDYGWIESESPMVAFSTEYVTHTDTISYWVPTKNVTENDIVYEADTLYRWIDNQWTQVAKFESNVNNRIISSIKQTVNDVSADVTNAAGSIASLSVRLGNDESVVREIAEWKTLASQTMAETLIQADENAASIALVVSKEDDVNKINAASIVTAINDAGSSVTLNADHINLEGVTTFLKPSDVGSSGKTVIYGDRITGGSIQSNNYISGESGLKINLNDGTWDSKYLQIDYTGKITASSGIIGNWNIDSNSLYGYQVGMSTKNDRDISFWAGYNSIGRPFDYSNNDDGNMIVTPSFYVKKDGSLYSTKGKIGGWTIGDGYLGTKSETIGDNFFLCRNGSNTYSYAVGAYADLIMDLGGKFAVDTSGTLYATGAVISGDLTAGSITASAVSICGRNISEWMNNNGYIYEINANTGYVGNWNITGNYIYSEYTEETYPNYKQTVIFHTTLLEWGSTNPDVYSISSPWESVIRAANAFSDKRIKHDIRYLSDNNVLENFFDRLKPCEYKFNEDAMCGSPDEIHYGFIAQDVQSEIGDDWQNYAFVFNSNDRLNLLYKEFIPLNTWQIQKLKTRVSELETKVLELESLINKE